VTRILVTNDDGIDSPGLHALVEALSDVGSVTVVAPDRNRSAVSRSITLSEMLHVSEESVAGADLALATDGTPTDCVRMAVLGLAGEQPDIVVSGANRGLNLGDDVTYSGTVAAAFEGVLNGLPAIAVSQQTIKRELGYPRIMDFNWTAMQAFIPKLVQRVLDNLDAFPTSGLLSVNVPGCDPQGVNGVEVTRLGRRIYRDRLELKSEAADGRKQYSLYGDDPSHHDEEGTDIAAIGRGCIAVTPLRFQLADMDAIAEVDSWNLGSLMGQGIAP
jgi:5'-nucleotidase